MKICVTCKELKNPSEFYKKTSAADGLASCCKKCSLDYKRANRDRYNKRQSELRAMKTPEQKKAVAEYVAAWWKTEEGKNCQRRSNHRRKALRKGLPHQKYILQEIIDRDGTKCWMCSKDLESELKTMDHLIALDVDQELLATWNIKHPGDVLANIAIACKPCNSGKRNKLMLCAVNRYFRNLKEEIAMTQASLLFKG